MGLYGKEKGKMSDRIMIAGTEYTLLENTATFPKVGSVACQGVRGAYSEQAAKRIFNQTRPMFFKTFGAVIHAVKCGMCEFGVLPIENNSYGSVRGVYEALRTAGVHIVHGDRILIRHQLLVKPGTKFEEITSIRSHEQAIGQCASFLREVEDHIHVVPVLNTAVAARYVAKTDDPGAAAIASPEAGAVYGLQSLENRVSDSDNNYTRFVCVTTKPVIYPGANRISMILSVSHTPGALYETIGRFANRGVNIIKLESCPIVGRDFEFRFFLDAEASCADPVVAAMINELSETCPEFVFLGNYAEA